MDNEERPFWIRSQEHGVLAEARTRAFLLERFWILERSVDIDGADFIIQRRLNTRSLLDRVPPRLGFIQSKYYADKNSTQYVHKEYVVDSENQARSEFFLMCHSGKESTASAYILSAQEIVDNFRVADQTHSKSGSFILPGTHILTQRYAILDQRTILDRLEQAMKNADFIKNRSFFSWALPTILKEELPLKEEFLEPIDNWWGDIPKEFYEMRRIAMHAQYDIEDVLDKLRTIEKSDDPELALDIAEELRYSYGNRVSIPEDLYNEDFQSAVKYHKARYDQLKKSGLLNAYSALRRKLANFIIKELGPKMPLTSNQVFLIKVNYNSDTFVDQVFQSDIKEIIEIWPKPDTSWRLKDVPDSPGILSASPGGINAYLVPSHHSYNLYKNGKLIEDTRAWPEKILTVAEWQAAYVAETILKIRFGEI